MSRKDKMFATLAREHADAQAEIARLKDEIAKQMLADEMLRGLYDDEAADVARLNAELRALRAGQDALVAATVEAAARSVENDADEFDHPSTHYTFGRLAKHIRALTTADATAALADMLRAERNKALRDAAAVCNKNAHVSGWASREAILYMIETEGK